MNIKNNDEKAIAEWLNVEPERIEIEIEMESINKFLHQIKEMLLSYKDYPSEEKRTRKILKLLKKGELPFPVYIEKEDKSFFIMEGRHRIVAFYLLGLKIVPVAKCCIK